ncbi:MAG: FAD-dependent oxidoreductase, partial [Burkholderiaceae bacterium]
MQASDAPVLRDVVLLGGGHSHVVALRNFAMRPMPGIRLTLVCTDVMTPYSGMLPGYVAGHYSFEDVHIDLDRLAQFAGARFIAAEAIGLDRSARRVLLRGRPALAYDRLSIDIGSTPGLDGVPGVQSFATAVKPIAQFNRRWLGLLERVRTHSGTSTIAVVGAGAGGVELLLAMQYRLRKELHATGRSIGEPEFHLFCAGGEVLPTHAPSVQRRFERVLRVRKVQVHVNATVDEVAEGRLHSASTGWVDADEIVWVTHAAGAAWLRETGLDLDESGFLR